MHHILNKQPYVMEAVNVLDDILRPDARSPSNKASMIRELQLVTKYRRGLKVRSHTEPQVVGSPRS